jgi:hypothetical protein
MDYQKLRFLSHITLSTIQMVWIQCFSPVKRYASDHLSHPNLVRRILNKDVYIPQRRAQFS